MIFEGNFFSNWTSPPLKKRDLRGELKLRQSPIALQSNPPLFFKPRPPALSTLFSSSNASDNQLGSSDDDALANLSRRRKLFWPECVLLTQHCGPSIWQSGYIAGKIGMRGGARCPIQIQQVMRGAAAIDQSCIGSRPGTRASKEKFSTKSCFFKINFH